MADIDQTTQQEFLPEKKPSLWQRLRFMSPKKKVLFWGAIVIAVVAAGLIIYFALAEDETRFYFKDDSHSEIANIDDAYIQENVTKKIEVWIEFDRPEPAVEWQVDDFEMEIRVTSDAVDIDCEGVQDISTCQVQNDANGKLIRINFDPSLRLASRVSANISDSEKVATIEATATDERAMLNLDFASGSVNKVNWERLDGGGGVVDTKEELIGGHNLFHAYYKTLGYDGGDYIYLEPIQSDIYLGDTLDVAVRIVSTSKDIVAVGTTLKYDPQFFEVNISGSLDFPVTGSESYNSGEIVLVRGIYGDGDPDNGMPNPRTIATLEIRGISPTTAAEKFEFSNTNVVIDDGQGTLINNYLTRDGSYQVIEEPPFEAELKIISGPDAYVYKNQSGELQVDIVWTTNMNSDTLVTLGTVNQSGASNVKEHSVTLEAATLANLSLGNTYDYAVSSTSGDKTVTATGEFVFQEHITQLEIKNLSVQPSYTSAVISWNTVGGDSRGKANAKIESCTPSVSNLPADLNNYTQTHSLRVTGLSTVTNYTCVVKSETEPDENGDTEEISGSVNFTTKSGQSPDANIILKVEPDRECDKWLYCRSAVQVVNGKNEVENLCFDIGACDELGEDGTCILPLDIQGLAEQIYSDPNAIQNLSGLAKVGFTWSDGSQVDGYYHYADMQPEGLDINIPNGDFELNEVWPWGVDEDDNAAIRVMPDPEDSTNKVLKITPLIPASAGSQWSNAWAPIGQIYPSTEITPYNYAISLGIKAGVSGTQTKDVVIQLKVGNAYQTIDTIPVNGYWQNFVFVTQSLNNPGEGYLNIGSRYYGDDDTTYLKELYIDNVSMKSILPVASDINQQRVCRLYPSSTAVACDYTDLSGKQYRGWQGFCVEEDPKYSSFDPSKQMCLNWWPVDILPGETDIFGTDQQAGYSGRQPLYYCLEAAGNYPYYNHQIQGYCGQNCGWYESLGSTQSFYLSNTGLDIYKDEILEIKINGIKIDGDSHGDFDCGLGNDHSSVNPSIPVNDTNKGASGTIIFNEKNKEHWTDELNTVKECKDGEISTAYNKYAYLRCAHNGEENDCNIMTARLGFDDNNKLEKVQVKFSDPYNGGKAQFEAITITFKGPRCDVLAQVVEPDGENVAWSARVQSGGWTQENTLGYEYGQDYAPYGAAVVPTPVSDPALWEDPLYIMPADSSMGIQKPYQVRAGSPYGADQKAGQEKIGTAQCVAGSADNLGSQCDSNIDCGYSLEGEGYGLCVGVNLTDSQISNISGGWQTGEENLQKLFAKSYKIWHWTEEDGVMKYVDITGQVEDGEYYSWDITDNSGMSVYRPQVINIKIGDRDESVTIQGPKSVVLKFNVLIDENHLPMTAYRVNWDDGTAISQVSNLKIYPRTNPDKPHVLFHTYECDSNSRYYNSTDGGCVYVPKIQVQDNWGWCNNGIDGDKCPSDINSWTEFDGEVIVTE